MKVAIAQKHTIHGDEIGPAGLALGTNRRECKRLKGFFFLLTLFLCQNDLTHSLLPFVPLTQPPTLYDKKGLFWVKHHSQPLCQNVLFGQGASVISGRSTYLRFLPMIARNQNLLQSGL